MVFDPATYVNFHTRSLTNPINLWKFSKLFLIIMQPLVFSSLILNSSFESSFSSFYFLMFPCFRFLTSLIIALLWDHNLEN
jgi:hypothetical protein